MNAYVYEKCIYPYVYKYADNVDSMRVFVYARMYACIVLG